MKNITRLLTFTRPQTIGIAALLLLAVILQSAILLQRTAPQPSTGEEKQWLALSAKLDSAQASVPKKIYKAYPFNPNFISDEKGYRIGMSVDQIDRLHAFRQQGKFVNSASEFQAVTGISDSLLGVISPQFKFPDWVGKRKFEKPAKTKKIVQTDINLATPGELIAVYGIGPALSERILDQREKLGAFVSMDQMGHVWGISAEVAQKLRERFLVAGEPAVKKINVNTASVRELGQFPYFRYPLSKSIVTFRSMNGNITRENLAQINGFPVDKLDIIAVYLEF